MTMNTLERGIRLGYENQLAVIKRGAKPLPISPHWSEDFRQGVLAGRDMAKAENGIADK